MSTNLHVSLTSFENESRILKESSSLIDAGFVDRVRVTALGDGKLNEYVDFDNGRSSAWRIELRSRKWPRNLLFQGAKYFEYAARVLSHGRDIQATVITIHSLALLPLGVVAKWLLKARLVYDCHELETETFGLTGLRQNLSRIVERLLIGHADLVIVVSESIRRWYADSYGITNIVTVLNCPPYRKPRRTRRLHESLSIPEDRKIVIYQGGIIKGRGVESLLEAFAGHDDGEHVLVCMGYGDLEGMVKDHADRYENIYLQKAVPPDVVLEYTASADYGVSYIDNPSLNDRYCLPNKLFEYIMAGLPVIVNDAPEQKRLVKQTGIGVVLGELSSDSMSGALGKLASLNNERLEASIGATAREYSWENQADVLIKAHRTHLRNGT
ncbi:MAG TPA: glycosyl transferase family 1 [Gemmatimonadetes bacterium]|mgnify:CR=1 FL=1|nr:glycosyl transferase family 1 [Gemmatimonadota bacterium]